MSNITAIVINVVCLMGQLVLLPLLIKQRNWLFVAWCGFWIGYGVVKLHQLGAL